MFCQDNQTSSKDDNELCRRPIRCRKGVIKSCLKFLLINIVRSIFKKYF